MIPREILKKIRQIEIRTNELVSGTLVSQSLGEAKEVSRGQDRIGGRRPRCAEENVRVPDGTSESRIPFSIAPAGANDYRIQNRGRLPLTRDCPRLISFVPSGQGDSFSTPQLRYFASSLALISSQETTSPGFSRWSWRRRSISSASPGVSSFDSTMSFQRLRHSSICSASVSARASLKTISELMELNLTGQTHFASA